jgi:RimJ/RimL family protein N-acetyltransferase
VPFDYQPVLAGELLMLRPLRPDDLDALFAVASDPLIWEQHPDQTRHEDAGFRTFFDEALASGGALIAIDAATQRVIGSSRFHGYDEQRSEVEIGWTFLARPYWGGLYNGEMKRLMIQHALKYAGCIVLMIGQDNLRSQRAAEKIGAVRVGSKDDHHGQPHFVYHVTAATPPST